MDLGEGVRQMRTERANLARVAALVRSERKRRDWTQEYLAEQAGVSLGWVSNFEGERTARPHPQNLRNVLRVLGLEAEAGDERAAETREEWPQDVRTFLDVIGIFLSAQPEERRAELIYEVTRRIVKM